MKIFTTILFLSIFTQITTAQTGSIQGRVTTADGKGAGDVTVVLKDSKFATMANSEGNFIFKKVPVGPYLIVISFTGLKPEEKSVIVSAGKAAEVNIQLAETLKRLDEVIINSRKTLNERKVSAGKMEISNMDLPQTVATISNAVISDQQAIRVGDVIKNVSGVSLTQTRLGVNETYSARGYSIGVNGAGGSILKNGLITNTSGMPEAATLESVEVLKGSTAMLYGNVSGGLIVNLVTKKPKFDFGGEVKMYSGSNQQYKPIVDIYGPISKNIAFRVVGTYENANSYRDVVKTKRTYVNPSLLFKLGTNTSLLVQGDYLDARLTPDFGIGALDSGRALPTGVPRSRFLNVLWAYNNIKQSSGSFNLVHDFTGNLQLNISGGLQKTDVSSYGAGLPNIVSKTGDWNRNLVRAHTIENNYTTQVNLTGKFNTGGIVHQTLIGADVTRLVTETNAFKITSNGATVTTYDKINILDPSLYTRRNDVPDAAVTTVTTAPSNRLGIYAQDLISLTKKFKLLGAIRWSYQETVRTKILTAATGVITNGTAATANDKAFSPKAAIIYQPAKTTSVFASYAKNFTINTGTDIYGQLLAPSLVDQYELGVKNTLLKGKLSANVSIYRILNSNLAQQAEFRADGTANADATVRELRGQTTSDGLEVDLNGAISQHVYFIAGYGYNNMRFTKTKGSKGSNIEGEKLVNNPQHTANTALFYTFSKGKLSGVKLGASAFYTGNRLGGYNNTVGQTQIGSRLLTLKGFTTVDITAGYAIGKYSLLAKLSNIFNTLQYVVHDNYSISPIAPRQFAVTAAYKF